MTQPNIFIRYKNDGTSDLSLTALGESMAGFDKAIKEIFKISKIDGELNVIPIEITQGSILINIVLEIAANFPFHQAKELLNFLMVSDISLYSEVLKLLNSSHLSINDLASRFPLDTLISWELGKFIINNLRAIPQLKKGLEYKDQDGRQLPTEYIAPLKKSLEKGVYKHALKPFVDDQVSEIEIGSYKSLEIKANITSNNFDGYFGEDEKILPDYPNGSIINLSGEIVGLQSNRSESMTYKSMVDGKWYSFVLFLPDDKSTLDYLSFYKEQTLIRAEILRKSLYQKPKLILKNISLVQPELDLAISD